MNVPSLLEGGLQLHRQGRLRDARCLYEQALNLDRDDPEASHLLGICLHDQGDFAAAESRLRAALRLKPASARFHLSYGNVLRELGRHEQAMQSYERACRLDPKLGLAHFNLGTALEETRRFAEAMACYERAFALGVGAPAVAGRANCLAGLGERAAALNAYEAALAMDPADQQVRAAWFLAQGRPGQALASIRQLREKAPGDVDLMIQHARALTGCHRLREARHLLQHLYGLRPENPDVVASLAWHHAALGAPQTAVSLCEDALKRFVDDAAILVSRGFAEFHLGQLAKARATLEQALAIRPESRGARMQLALVDLLEGNFAAGFANYECRWNDINGWLPLRSFTQPGWLGGEDLRSRTLLVYFEQGLGDTVQFVRYLPLLSDRVGRIVFEAPAAAVDIVRRAMPSEVAVVCQGSVAQPFDRVCPLLSLPLALGTTLDSIPAPGAYLAADPDRTRTWESRLGRTQCRRVGLAWSGSPSHNLDSQRSIALERVRNTLQGGAEGRADIEFIALQNSIRETDRAALAAFENLVYLGEAIEDLDDVAALIELCDLVISVDTSAAHLAGALGKPLWLLLSRVPDWRWLLEREDSPWYPSARLFRQRALGDWDEVLERVARQLRAGRAGSDAPSGH